MYAALVFYKAPLIGSIETGKSRKSPIFVQFSSYPNNCSLCVGGILIYYLRKLRHRVVEKLFKMLCLIYCPMLLGLSCLLLH
jgi:hypothetical protein